MRVKKAQWSSPWSHSQTLSSLHDVIGSMLGVLVQTFVQLQAVLADFYFSGLLEEGKVESDLESDDDDWHSFGKVQVRVHLLSANGAELSGSTRSKDPSLLPPYPTPNHTWRNSV